MIEPAGHRVIILPDPIEEFTAGGIAKPDMSKDSERLNTIKGTLVAVGPNAWMAFDDGEPWAKVGDRVIYAKYGGSVIKDNGVEYRIMNDEDIMAIVKED